MPLADGLLELSAIELLTQSAIVLTMLLDVVLILIISLSAIASF